MKRLSMLIVLVSLMGINAFAQTARTAHIKANLGLAKPSLMGSSQRIEDCDTFVNLCSDDTLAIWSTAGGYVAGQNEYGDKSKADIFLLPGTTIKGVLLYFGVGKAANTVDKFNVRVWDNDGTFGDGSPGGPGTVLGTKLVKYNDVKNDVLNGDLTYVQFSPAIAMPADSIFYCGIDFGYKAGDTIALVTTIDRAGLSCDGIITAVEQWDPAYYGGGWYSYATWGFTGISNMILPITCSEITVCELNIIPGGPELCQNKSKVLTASGATTYTWAPATGLNVTTGAVVTAEPTVTTTYTVTGNGGECTDQVTVTVLAAPTSNFTIGACSAGSRLLTRTGTPSTGVTFKWFRNGVKITGGATNSTYLATITGAYKVQTKLTATGCKKVSGEKTVTIDCKAGISGSAFTAEAYPNPFNQSVIINMASGSTELANVRLIDLSGRTLHEYLGVDTSAPFEINENLTPGVYFVRVSQGSTEKMIKVVKE